MKKLFATLVMNGIGLYVIDYLFDGIMISNSSLISLTVVLTILNVTLKPFLKIISLPFTILTIGLFGIVINGAVLYAACQLSGNGVMIAGFGEAVGAGIILSILNAVLQPLLGIES